MQRRAEFLRFVAVRLRLPELVDVVRAPGINEAYRLTIQYHDGRHPNQTATLTYAQSGAVLLSVAYLRTTHQPVFEYPMDAERFQAFDLAIRRSGFDRRDDQPDVPYTGVDLWLLERASGGYFHDVVLAPGQAVGIYSWMVDAVQQYLPEAVRAIQPD